MSGAEEVGELTGKRMRVRRESAPIQGHRRKTMKRIASRVAVFGLPISGIIGGAYVAAEFDSKNDRIQSLEESVDNKQRLLDAATVLGGAGVRFSDISLIDDSVVVEVPGTGAECQSISFNYSSSTEGWMLGIQQQDAAGRTYDTPEASSAASVSALVDDLCS